MSEQTPSSDTLDLKVLLTTLIAYRNGDFTARMPVDWIGVPGKIADTINALIDMSAETTVEFERVAQIVGRQGKLGERIVLPAMKGSWAKLVDSSNALTSNLVSPMSDLIRITGAVAEGDLSQKASLEIEGIKLQGQFLQSAQIINAMVTRLATFSSEVTRVAREVGTEGKLGGQATVSDVSGIWKDLTDSVNSMAANLTGQVRNIAQVTTAVANGDLSKQITVEARGEIQELKATVNTMVDQLNSFASEVTRVAREVGTEGKLGGQATVVGVSGIWKDLTDSVNGMAANLTGQVRNIAQVTTAVANGDLGKKISVEASGEILDLKNTINTMVDQLNSFSAEVTRVAREVGTEGNLDSQALVRGVSGIWKSLTENVNEMIRNLRETTRQNADQNWLKTNLAKFTRLMQGQRDLAAVSQRVLSELAPLINAQHGVFYVMDESAPDNPRLKMLSAYAYRERKNLSSEWKLGEGIVGQCALEKQRILLTHVPADYVEITSGLGEGKPLNIIDLPILFENKVRAVIEMASFTLFSPIHQTFLDQLAESIGIVLNTIEANQRTEELLKQSQSLTQELGSQQEELRQTNEELEDKAQLLEEQKNEVERKNSEVEAAKFSLEEKAEQLALTSRYKSEFLSNMSHELRTPLNSLLILAQQLAENPKHNLDDQQVEYARVIQGSGKDLLSLINEILDLSKIESGTVTLDISNVPFDSVREQTERTFRHVADSRGLTFGVELAPGLPETLRTDEKRLQQVIKNLLSNAFKFTDKGQVTVRIEPVTSGWSVDHAILNRAGKVIAFEVIDTGIGIPANKRRIIFEAFQQADGTTARKYGGTGLGLSISREIAHLLGGELRLSASEPGRGSTFVLFLPLLVPETAQGGELSGGGGAERRPEWPSRAVPDRAAKDIKAETPAPEDRQAPVPADDREAIGPDDRTLLIVEDDPRFSDILLDAARQKGFKGIVAARGSEALQWVERAKPTAITLDLHLPDMDGWEVLERLKRNPDTRHIPVEIISVDDARPRGLRRGAFEYLVKPVTVEALQKALTEVKKFTERQVRDLLLADGDNTHRQVVADLIGNGDVRIQQVASGKAALAALKKKRYDCMVLDLVLPDMPGLDLIEAMQANALMRDMPVILHGAAELQEKDRARLDALAGKGIVKEVHSPERLFDETALFLHRVVSRLPEDRRRMLESLYQSADNLPGKKVMVVDDDVRNIFALTSVLEHHQMQVISAENGLMAIDLLKKNPDTHIVLMDIMMPEMDGYETMKQIRKIKKFASLPLIALTAKAMTGDREKCIEAGASDYVSKPVDTDQLLSLMRVWLYKP